MRRHARTTDTLHTRRASRRADDTDRVVLTDDGTMDTVVLCRSCGAEGRYNYDGAATDPAVSDEAAYAAFVAWAISDFTNDHDCADAREGEN